MAAKEMRDVTTTAPIPLNQMSKLCFPNCEYAENILRRLQEFTKTRKFCDVIVVAGNHSRRALMDPLILATTSQYLANFFMANEDEQQQNFGKIGVDENEVVDKSSTTKLAAEAEHRKCVELPTAEDASLVGILRRKGSNTEKFVTMKGLIQLQCKRHDSSEFNFKGLLRDGNAHDRRWAKPYRRMLPTGGYDEEMDSTEKIKCFKDFCNRICKKLEGQEEVLKNYTEIVSAKNKVNILGAIGALWSDADLECDEELRDEIILQNGGSNLKKLELITSECQTDDEVGAGSGYKNFIRTTRISVIWRHQAKNYEINSVKIENFLTEELQLKVGYQTHSNTRGVASCESAVCPQDHLRGGDDSNQVGKPLTTSNILSTVTEDRGALAPRKAKENLKQLQDVAPKLHRDGQPLHLSLRCECKGKEITLTVKLKEVSQYDLKIPLLGGKLLQFEIRKIKELTVSIQLSGKQDYNGLKAIQEQFEQKNRAKAKRTDALSIAVPSKNKLTLNSISSEPYMEASSKDMPPLIPLQQKNSLPSWFNSFESIQRISKEGFKGKFDIWKHLGTLESNVHWSITQKPNEDNSELQKFIDTTSILASEKKLIDTRLILATVLHENLEENATPPCFDRQINEKTNAAFCNQWNQVKSSNVLIAIPEVHQQKVLQHVTKNFEKDFSLHDEEAKVVASLELLLPSRSSQFQIAPAIPQKKVVAVPDYRRSSEEDVTKTPPDQQLLHRQVQLDSVAEVKNLAFLIRDSLEAVKHKSKLSKIKERLRLKFSSAHINSSKQHEDFPRIRFWLARMCTSCPSRSQA